MKKSVSIRWGITGILVVLLGWTAMTAMSVGNEASAADKLLKQTLNQHLTQPEIDAKLHNLGFAMSDSPASSKGVGPTHSVLLYSTHLTVDLEFDAQGKNTSYHIDRV